MSTSTKKMLQAAAGSAGGDPVYVEDVFATNLYIGNDTTNIVTNGIDLDGEGGMVWQKRINSTKDSSMMDSAQGKTGGYYWSLTTSNTDEQYDFTGAIATFNSNGYTMGRAGYGNNDAEFHVSYTWRKAPGFFDMVTYSGNGSSSRAISHNLDSVPGCIIIKRIDSAGDNFIVGHKDLTAWAGYYLKWNTTAGLITASDRFDANPTSTTFTIGSETDVNGIGGTFIAYLFASEDARFGEDLDESIINCGTYLGSSGSDRDIALGWEPQWVLIKNLDRTDNWTLLDNMRGWSGEEISGGTQYDPLLSINLMAGEVAGAVDTKGNITRTGFTIPTTTSTQIGESGEKYIFIAIRRPMKVPEAGTEVYSAEAYTGNSTAGRILAASAGFPLDLLVTQGRNVGIEPILYDKMRFNRRKFFTYSAGVEGASGTNVLTTINQEGFTAGTDADINGSYTYIAWMFKRAHKFMTIIPTEGDSVMDRQLVHKLGTTPEMIWIKSRSAAESWHVYHKDSDGSAPEDYYLKLDSNYQRIQSAEMFNDVAPTATVINLSSYNSVNGSGKWYMIYAWATVDGVSKIGNYTGTGSAVDVDCGFSAGARFILIKRADSTGDWYVYDSARGIVAGNDPYQTWNNAGTETTGTDYIDPLASGFTVTSAAGAEVGLNDSGGNYIFMAIA